MVDIPRRTIDELAFTYERHPERRDVFAEGPGDHSILRWFLSACGLKSVAVYDIGAIDVPDDAILAAGGKANNRERVIFLARALAQSDVHNVGCVVDADFDYLRQCLVECPLLFYTDYSCMEMYFFTADVFQKLLTVRYRHPDWPIGDVMGALEDVLQQFFLFRYANEELDWQMDWLEKLNCLKMDGWHILLDSDEYVKRFLSKNGRLGDRLVFTDKVEALRPHLLEDSKYQMHGHDLVAVLSWYLREKGESVRASNPDSIAGALALSSECSMLKQEPLFARLLEHLT